MPKRIKKEFRNEVILILNRLINACNNLNEDYSVIALKKATINLKKELNLYDMNVSRKIVWKNKINMREFYEVINEYPGTTFILAFFILAIVGILKDK